MSVKTKIHIENPCAESWQKMSPDKDGRFCNSCNKVVVDFSHKSINEIQNYLSISPVCGRYSLRHTTAAGKWENFLNAIEITLSKYKLQKVALFLITIMLFLSGCHRRLQGAYANFNNFRSGDGSTQTNNDTTTKSGIKLIEIKEEPK